MIGKILFLCSDAHGGFGGISQYNRDVIDALSSKYPETQIFVIPRSTETKQIAVPQNVEYAFSATSSKVHFAARSLLAAATQRFDFIYCAHVNLLPLAIRCKRAQNCPLILAVYGIDVWQPPYPKASLHVLRDVDRILSISDVTKQRMQAWSDVGDNKFEIVPNAIRHHDYKRQSDTSPRPGLLQRRNGSETFIGTMGRLVGAQRAKGFDELLNLMPRLLQSNPHYRYVVIGDGPDRARLEKKAASIGVKDQVIFTGRISDTDKIAYLANLDVFAMPSRGEGFGFVILEALASGTPVVASIQDGTREAVLNGELGICVDPDDPESILSGIKDALAKEKGPPPGLQYFSFENFSNRVGKLFENTHRE